MLPRALLEGAVNRLTLHAVDDGTNWVYTRAVRAFLQDARRCQLVFRDVDDIDRAAAAYMQDLCFLGGAGPMAGSNLLSGLTH
eukprot:8851217-Lingulodinium_polyedra.AAC.1